MSTLIHDLEQACHFGGLALLKDRAAPAPYTDLKSAAVALSDAAEEVLDAIEAAALDRTLTRSALRGLVRVQGAFMALPDPVAEPKRFMSAWTSPNT